MITYLAADEPTILWFLMESLHNPDRSYDAHFWLLNMYVDQIKAVIKLVIYFTLDLLAYLITLCTVCERRGKIHKKNKNKNKLFIEF
jgi:hypothetical protein